MQHNVSQPPNTPQAGSAVEIAEDWPYSVGPPNGQLRPIAQQGVNSVMAEEVGKSAASDITTADDQKFLHDAILPDSDSPGDLMEFQISIQANQPVVRAEEDETIRDAASRLGQCYPELLVCQVHFSERACRIPSGRPQTQTFPGKEHIPYSFEFANGVAAASHPLNFAD